MLKQTLLLASALLSLPVFAQDDNPYDDIGYVNNDWLLPYAWEKEGQLIADGLRLATYYSVTEWVKEEKIDFPDGYVYRETLYRRSSHMPQALGEVGHEYVLKRANELMATDNSKGACEPVIIVDWEQPSGCRTPFYKRTGNIFEPLTCEDQGITTSFATSRKAYFLILLSYCQEELVPQNLNHKFD